MMKEIYINSITNLKPADGGRALQDKSPCGKTHTGQVSWNPVVFSGAVKHRL